jgi:hypothetical protein
VYSVFIILDVISLYFVNLDIVITKMKCIELQIILVFRKVYMCSITNVKKINGSVIKQLVSAATETIPFFVQFGKCFSSVMK